MEYSLVVMHNFCKAASEPLISFVWEEEKELRHPHLMDLVQKNNQKH